MWELRKNQTQSRFQHRLHFSSYSFLLARSLFFTMHSQTTDLLPALALLRALWDRTESQGKHTHKRKQREERKNLSEEQCGRVKKWRKQARKWKSSQDSVREPDRGKVLRTGQQCLYKKRGFSSPFKRTCSLDLSWTPLIKFFQVFQPFHFNH